MIGKIQDALKHVEEIAQLKEEIKKSSKEIIEAKESILTYKKQLTEEHAVFKKEHIQLHTESQRAVQRLQHIIPDFEKELATFKTMKSQLQTDAMTRVSADIKKELQAYIAQVKERMQELQDASVAIKQMSQHTSEILASMQSVVSLGATIKKQDFELAKYAQTLRHNDKEKLELMKKVDMLERLVSQMRRQQRQR